MTRSSLTGEGLPLPEVLRVGLGEAVGVGAAAEAVGVGVWVVAGWTADAGVALGTLAVGVAATDASRVACAMVWE